jgi:hypothetical protein
VHKDKFFAWGIILIIVGYLISLNPYWLIFGTPIIYIIGCIFIGLSTKRLFTKILIISAPIIMWIPGFWALCYFGSARVTPSTFLIPTNFRGKIVLYYGEPCGEELIKENGRYMYHIPNNGIMILKNPLETGIIDEEYYIVDSAYKKVKKLSMMFQQDFNEDYTVEKNKHEPVRNQLGVFLGGTGTGITDFDHKKYFTSELYVDSWDSLRVFNNVKFDTTSLNILKGCRLKKY